MAGGDPITAPGSGGAFSDAATAAAGSQANTQDAINQAVLHYMANPQLQTFIQQEYAQDAWMMNVPELAGVIIATAYYGWDQGHVDNALFQTNWWKSNGSGVAQWNQLLNTDPASANQQIATKAADVQASAYNLGVQITQAQASSLAQQAIEFSWGNAQLDQAVGAMFKGQTNPPTGGTAASFQDNATQLVQKYAVPVSQDTMNYWTNLAVTQAGAGGSSTGDTMSGFEDFLRTQAKATYSFMDKAIDQGITPQQWFAPYSQAAANVLDISPDSIQWSDPKWLSAVTQQQPGGVATPVNLTQFQTTLRSDPQFGWSKTANAVSAAYSTAKQIATTFGKVA